jgi:hypothetical protein
MGFAALSPPYIFVMAGLVPSQECRKQQDVDARNKCGHDGLSFPDRHHWA